MSCSACIPLSSKSVQELPNSPILTSCASSFEFEYVPLLRQCHSGQRPICISITYHACSSLCLARKQMYTGHMRSAGVAMCRGVRVCWTQVGWWRVLGPIKLRGAGAARETETSRFVREAFFQRPLRSTMHSCKGRAKSAEQRAREKFVAVTVR